MLLFTEYHLQGLPLKNRMVMAPMTRCRAMGHLPNELMAQYYAQRSVAGLIVSEGVAPSPDGCGYARMPGIWSDEQVNGWRKVTNAVHDAGGKIFVQLMHTGRMSHPLNMPEGSVILAPSAVQPGVMLRTDQSGLQQPPVAKEMTLQELSRVRSEYRKAASNAIRAGFDGVELHGANGYLLEQFLSPHSNRRTDAYGGTLENRCRFVVETMQEVADEIGALRTGMRFSPYGVHGDMPEYPEIDPTYAFLAAAANKAGIGYLHLVDHSASGAPVVPERVRELIRQNFRGTLILSGGYDAARAEHDLQKGLAGLIAFGKPFISNPDLPERFRNGWPLATPDPSTFYTPGAEGYTSYSFFGSTVPLI